MGVWALASLAWAMDLLDTTIFSCSMFCGIVILLARNFQLIGVLVGFCWRSIWDLGWKASTSCFEMLLVCNDGPFCSEDLSENSTNSELQFLFWCHFGILLKWTGSWGCVQSSSRLGLVPYWASCTLRHQNSTHPMPKKMRFQCCAARETDSAVWSLCFQNALPGSSLPCRRAGFCTSGTGPQYHWQGAVFLLSVYGFQFSCFSSCILQVLFLWALAKCKVGIAGFWNCQVESCWSTFPDFYCIFATCIWCLCLLSTMTWNAFLHSKISVGAQVNIHSVLRMTNGSNRWCTSRSVD